MNGVSFATEFVRGLAREAGWPAVKTRRREIPAGEASWRRFLAGCTIFDLGSAERALQAHQAAASLRRGPSATVPGGAGRRGT